MNQKNSTENQTANQYDDGNIPPVDLPKGEDAAPDKDEDGE